MKLFLSSILSLVFITTSHAQVGKKIFEHIKTQNIQGIVDLANTEIDLCLMDDQNIYTRAEAKDLLTEFFIKNKPVSCEAVHSGNSRGQQSAYVLGKLKTQNGNVFRVFVYANDKDQMMELRIHEW